MQKLFLLDASGYLYRAYFALPSMTNPQGATTQALYGFIRMISRLQKDFAPQHMIAVFDGPKNKQARMALYAQYKANREKAPSDLIAQIMLAQKFCQYAGISYIAAEGVEADDTIGSIAKWAAKKGTEVLICSADKDLCQLVDEKISILNTFKDNLVIDAEKVKEMYGVTPAQIVDYLAIIGDTSDNIPGIKGFGPKTAVALLDQFGSLEALLQNIDQVEGEKKQNTLRQEAETARLSYLLAKIDTSVPFPKDESFFVLSPDMEQKNLIALYQEMGFKSLLKELPVPAAAPPVAMPVNYQLIDSIEAFEALCEVIAQSHEVCFDTETTALHPLQAKLVGVGFAIEPCCAYYIPLNGNLDATHVLQKLKELFENPSIGFYAHNIKYDTHVLQNHGITIVNICFDTMLASYLLYADQHRHNLDVLSLEHFHHTKIPIESLIGKGKKQISMQEVPIASVCTYCCEDVDFCVRLKQKFKANLIERDLMGVFQEIELPLTRILVQMERVGIYIDTPFLQKLAEEVKNQLSHTQAHIYELAEEEFNLNSPKQLSGILYDKLQLRPPKAKATLSTAADVLEAMRMQHPIIAAVLEYRGLEKLRSTYIDALPQEVLPQTKRIHCSFNQFVAATGRLSSQNPNLQNIPVRTEMGRLIRHAFKPQDPSWYFLGGDYSQIELRILAHLSEDPLLIYAFQHGIDVHKATAAEMFQVKLDEVTPQQRYQAKAINFGIIYGQQAFGLAQELNISVKEAARFIDNYFERYRGVKEYLEKQKELARKTMRATTMMKRQRLLPDINSKNGMIRQASERLAINAPIQGSAADLIKLAMIQVARELQLQKLQSRLLLQIHDELLFEVPPQEIEIMKELVKNAMEKVWSLKVPLIVDIAIGKNWQEC